MTKENKNASQLNYTTEEVNSLLRQSGERGDSLNAMMIRGSEINAFQFDFNSNNKLTNKFNPALPSLSSNEVYSYLDNEEKRFCSVEFKEDYELFYLYYLMIDENAQTVAKQRLQELEWKYSAKTKMWMVQREHQWYEFNRSKWLIEEVSNVDSSKLNFVK